MVINYSRSREEAEATAAALGERGCEAIAVEADVTDEAVVAPMVELTVRKWGRLDALVNNAGTTRFIPFDDLDALTDDVWDELLDVNVKAAFRCTRLAAPHLREAHGRRQRRLSRRPTGHWFLHPPTRSARLRSITSPGRSRRLWQLEVRVNAIAPGGTATRWARQGLGEELAEDQEAATARATPLGGSAARRIARSG